MSEYSQHLYPPIETKTAASLSEKEMVELNSFATDEYEPVGKHMKQLKKTGGKLTPEWQIKWNSAANHIEGLKTIKVARKENIQMTISIARDMNEKIVGFSFFSIDPEKKDPLDKVDLTYTGVTWQSQGKGIGERLLDERHRIMLQQGITAYKARLWKKSEVGTRRLKGSWGLFQKLQNQEKIARIESLDEKMALIYLKD